MRAKEPTNRARAAPPPCSLHYPCGSQRHPACVAKLIALSHSLLFDWPETAHFNRQRASPLINRPTPLISGPHYSSTAQLMLKLTSLSGVQYSDHNGFVIEKVNLITLSGSHLAFANKASLERQLMKDDYPKQPSTYLYIAHPYPWLCLSLIQKSEHRARSGVHMCVHL